MNFLRHEMGVSENSGTPKSSILIGFSIIFTIHFGGFPLFFGNTHMTFGEGPFWGIFFGGRLGLKVSFGLEGMDWMFLLLICFLEDVILFEEDWYIWRFLFSWVVWWVWWVFWFVQSSSQRMCIDSYVNHMFIYLIPRVAQMCRDSFCVCGFPT